MELLLRKPKSGQSNIALHLMINQLSLNNLSEAIKNENTIENNIPAELKVGTDMHKLASIVGSLLSSLVTHNKKTALQISVKKYHDVILMHFKANTEITHPEFPKTLESIQILAASIGGSVDVTSFRNNVSTIALSFVNRKVA